jgi:thioredoxin-related protein
MSSLSWKSFDEGILLAGQTNKKILVDVYTDWCSWCKKMDSDVYTDKEVIGALNASFVLVKLNAESDKTVNYKGKALTERQFAGTVGVTGYPSTLFFESSGKPITLLPGFVPAPKFLPILRYIGENHYQSVSFEDYLAKTSGPSAP